MDFFGPFLLVAGVERPMFAATSRRAGSSLDARSELTQEAHVIFEKQLDVVDSIFQHRNSLDTHAKSEPRIDFGIITHKSVHLRIHHP
jgi:hypothetical protein